MSIETEKPEEFDSDKIISIKQASLMCEEEKSKGKTVGMCHGGFDLLHPGHIKHFQSAKTLCDILIASVTSDRFVSSRKGSGRPIFDEKLRAYSIASLESVNYVVISDFEKAIPIIMEIKPSFYIKGPDFINKTTPGITAEREAIKSVGGEMKYTKDVKLGTTEIIDYIKNRLDRKKIFVGIDRDGTLIEDVDFLGKDKDYMSQIKFNKPVIDLLTYLSTKHDVDFAVISNQGGVARGYFSVDVVEEINMHIDKYLRDNKIIIGSWQYCPDADKKFAEKRKDIHFDERYIKENTKRKPSPDMLNDALKEMNMKPSDFYKIIILGDNEDDKGLAQSINAFFIDVKNKGYAELINDVAILDL